MRKKSLSRLGIIVFFAFSTVTACTISLPSIQTSQPSTDKKNDNTVANQSDTSGSVELNNLTNGTTSSVQENGNLSNKASDANPLGDNASVISSPVPSSSANIGATPSPNPTATPSSTSVQGSGQLNVLINPNLPTKRTTP